MLIRLIISKIDENNALTLRNNLIQAVLYPICHLRK